MTRLLPRRVGAQRTSCAKWASRRRWWAVRAEPKVRRAPKAEAFRSRLRERNCFLCCRGAKHAQCTGKASERLGERANNERRPTCNKVSLVARLCSRSAARLGLSNVPNVPNERTESTEKTGSTEKTESTESIASNASNEPPRLRTAARLLRRTAPQSALQAHQKRTPSAVLCANCRI